MAPLLREEFTLDQKKVTYKDAGVDIDAGNRFVDMIKPLVKSTSRPEVLSDIGGFGGLFSFHADKYKQPILVSSTDGVGTKLKLAFLMDKHDTVGIDLVAMCVNDVIVQGAEPLFFLDYMATGKLTPEKATEVVKGVAAGCKQAGCALVGGETAEMPGFYSAGVYDIAGFTVGAVDKNNIIDGSTITVGDKIIGIASNGLHSNGFSLARKVFFEMMGLKPTDTIDGFEQSIGMELLTPTRIYVKTILNLIRDFEIKGMAHITGGGLLENVPRVLPHHCQATIIGDSWEKPPIFTALREGGNIDETEMHRTFNYGLGMVLIVPSKQCEEIMIRLSGLNETAWEIGTIDKNVEETPSVKLV